MFFAGSAMSGSRVKSNASEKSPIELSLSRGGAGGPLDLPLAALLFVPGVLSSNSGSPLRGSDSLDTLNRGQFIFLPAPCQYLDLSSSFAILPVTVFGSSSLISKDFGTLK
jgi:hypothetical protein